MWSEEINKKIEEGEGSNNPAYNDKAWEKMELLLDKHLPQKEKKKKIYFTSASTCSCGRSYLFYASAKKNPGYFYYQPGKYNC